MRPAWSIIFFTTMSGLGLGLAGWVVIGLLPFMTPSSLLLSLIHISEPTRPY